MPPKQRKKGGGGEDDVFTLEAELAAAGKAEEKKEEVVNLWDGPSLKRALDEAVVEAVQEHGHQVDNTWTDAKIVLGVLSCFVAGLAQLYPKKYPANFWLLVACVSAYVVLSTLMTVVAMVFEKDAILLTKPSPGGAPGLAVTTKLPRFQETFTLTIAPRGKAAAGSGGKGGGASVSRSVGAYFHSDGYLAKDVIKADVAQLLGQLIEEKSK